MEEIEILPRDVYLHTVNVTQAPCIIQWWFATKRKNIDFGLFQRQPQQHLGSGAASDSASLTGSIGPNSSARSTVGSAYGKRAQHQANTSSTGLTKAQSEGEVRSAAIPRSQAAELAARQRSLGYFRLQDRNVIELMPIKHYESSKSTIKGFWNAAETGTYVLYFDNSFSKKTSKRLSFCVALTATRERVEDKTPVAISGWLLKKKRKRMQGWANRWFTLKGHWLMYSTAEGGIPRAKLNIEDAVVSVSKEERAITIDGDEGFMRLRAQNDHDFQEWVAAIQNAKDVAASIAYPGNTVGAGISMGDGPSGNGIPIAAVSGQHDFVHAQKVHSSFEDSAIQLQRLLNGLPENAQRYLRLMRENEAILFSLLSSTDHLPQHLSDRSTPLSRQGTSNSSIAARIGSPPPISHAPSHASWLSGSREEIFYDTNEVLEFTRDESELTPSTNANDVSETKQRNGRTQDDSSITPLTENGTPAASDSDSDDNDGYFGDRDEVASRNIYSDRMRRDLVRDPEFVEALARNSLQLPTSARDLDEKVEDIADNDQDVSPQITLDHVRAQLGPNYEPRTQLPAETCEANVSLISILRKNVGKDLSSIAMPLVMNEPINALQALCEELVYSRLLKRADKLGDSLDRLMHVAAFAISTLSFKKFRAERKPFNPLLGETYEMVDHINKFRFVSEKVSHHPPIMACYADSPHYRFWQDSSGKSKFWGKSMELIQTSNVHIELPEHGDHFTYGKPSALVRGLITGSRSVDFTGEMNIVNHTTGDRCSINFKEATMFSASNDMVECYLYRGSDSSQIERVLRGSWSSQLRYEKSLKHSETLWNVLALPPESSRFYGFSYFTMRLNELSLGIKDDLPKTDTRFRPDQRAYEEGRLDDAEEIKHQLEEEQRARKREHEGEGTEWTPQWFEERDDEHSPTGKSWQYRGGYWEARKHGTFKPKIQLW